MCVDRRVEAVVYIDHARNLGNVLGIGIIGSVFNGVLARHAPPTAIFAAFHAGLWAVTSAATLGAVTSAARSARPS